jgi:ubiquinone/menaquinone biosynthesis C-methylase UbiE
MSAYESYIPLEAALARTPVDRDPEEQLGSLCLLEFQWNGRSICEIGTGKREQLAKHLKKKIGPTGHLTLINPDYEQAVDADGFLANTEIDARVRRFPTKAENLQLPEDSFDVILSSFSVPLHMDRKCVGPFFVMVMRALKQGGTARFYPIRETFIRYNQDLNALLQNPLQGFKISLRRPHFMSHGRPDTSAYDTLVIERYE